MIDYSWWDNNFVFEGLILRFQSLTKKTKENKEVRTNDQ